MNQILQEQQRRYLQGTGKIGRAQEIMDELEEKIAGYHERKRTEEQLLMSQEIHPQPTKTKSTFKLFTKPAQNTHHMNIQELDESSRGRGKGQVGQLLQEVEAIEQLMRKKLALKEERVGQMERQLQLEMEQKVHLYNQNCKLENQLATLINDQSDEQKRIKIEEQQLEAELKTLKQMLENKKNENKRMRKEEELLKQALKQAQNGRKKFHQGQLRSMRSHSRGTLQHHHEKPQEQERYLRALVGELDKLRKMVRQKMKKSKSKARIR